MTDPLASKTCDLPAARSPDRPAVVDLVTTPDGRTFRLLFQARQALPLHQNPERVVIATESGSGTLRLGESELRRLTAGVVVQLEPQTPHVVEADDDGLELTVTIAPSCCRMC